MASPPNVSAVRAHRTQSVNCGLPRAFSSAGVACFLRFQTYEKISCGRFLIIRFLLLRETRGECEPQPRPGEFMWRSCSVFYTIHQVTCLLRDPCNQKGGFHVENILLDISFTCNLFDILYFNFISFSFA